LTTVIGTGTIAISLKPISRITVDAIDGGKATVDTLERATVAITITITIVAVAINIAQEPCFPMIGVHICATTFGVGIYPADSNRTSGLHFSSNLA